MAAHQAPLSMGFSRQEHWSGLPLPSPGDLPDPGIEPASPALVGRLFTLSHQGALATEALIPQKDDLDFWAWEAASRLNADAGLMAPRHLLTGVP